MINKSSPIADEYLAFLNNRDFPCVAARAASTREQVKCFIASHMGCPKDDAAILQFLYDFIREYRKAKTFLHSAAIIFEQPDSPTENMFDELMWQRLQALSDLDAENYAYDSRVESNPSARNFSFSIMEEAFFIIGMHPGNSRAARQFRLPALIFNPHAQFEQLKKTGNYGKMKKIVRKRDMLYSGSVNPMLDDFGEASEALQYSGRVYHKNWQCPLKIKHG